MAVRFMSKADGMSSEPMSQRSREGRDAAERVLVRVVRHYGARPAFVVLGGLVPELLCSNGEILHAGTLDVDVQVNLEIASGAVNAMRLERALLNAGLSPEPNRNWCWGTDEGLAEPSIEFEAPGLWRKASATPTPSTLDKRTSPRLY